MTAKQKKQLVDVKASCKNVSPLKSEGLQEVSRNRDRERLKACACVKERKEEGERGERGGLNHRDYIVIETMPRA